jgi:hypothetical protein
MQHAKLNVATNKLDNLLHSLVESTTDEALMLKQQAQTHGPNNHLQYQWKSRLAVFFFSTVIHYFPLPRVTAFHFWVLLIVVAVLQSSESG